MLIQTLLVAGLLLVPAATIIAAAETVTQATSSDPNAVMLAVIAGGFSLLGTIATVVMTIMLARLNKKTDDQHKETGEKIDVIKKATDGLTSALVEVTGEKEHLKGEKQGRDAAEARAAPVAPPQVIVVQAAPTAAAPAVAPSPTGEPAPVKIVAAVPVPVQETPDAKPKP